MPIILLLKSKIHKVKNYYLDKIYTKYFTLETFPRTTVLQKMKAGWI